MPAGLHGAAVAITGRRDNVLRDAVAALQREGIRAHGIQASCSCSHNLELHGVQNQSGQEHSGASKSVAARMYRSH